MPKKTKIQILRDEIKADLLEQLEKNGIHKCYTDLIDDYMSMWDTKNKLIADISERGVNITYYSQAGTNQKKNDSVDQLIKLNAQMLKLLDSLGIKASQKEGISNENDEM